MPSREAHYPPGNPLLVAALEEYAELLRRTGRRTEAEVLEARAAVGSEPELPGSD